MLHAAAITVILAFSNSSASAATKEIVSLPKDKAAIEVYQVADSIVLGENRQKDITVRLVSAYLGQGTDMSPRYKLYITYFHGGELNNSKTAFELGSIWELKATRKLDKGIYKIQVVRLGARGNTEEASWIVDTVQVFADDHTLKKEEFDDPYFSSKIKVTE